MRLLPATTVVAPCLNDEDSLKCLIQDLEAVSVEFSRLDLLVVDDGSFPSLSPAASEKLNVQIIQLKRNLGHQKAIVCGLHWLAKGEVIPDSVVIMDSDGEDDPNVIPELVRNISPDCPIVLAQRGKRSEGSIFRLGYAAYQMVFKILIGFKLRHGNFSAFNADLLDQLLTNENTWTNYSAAVAKMRLPRKFIKIDRGERYQGESKMNLIGLIGHGFSAMSVFQEVLLLRIGIFMGTVTAGAAAIALFVLYQKLVTQQALLGWSSTIITILGVGLANMLLLTFLFLTTYLNAKNGFPTIPSDFADRYIKKSNSPSAKSVLHNNT